jgi:hypothetical protein
MSRRGSRAAGGHRDDVLERAGRGVLDRQLGHHAVGGRLVTSAERDVPAGRSVVPLAVGRNSRVYVVRLWARFPNGRWARSA